MRVRLEERAGFVIVRPDGPRLDLSSTAAFRHTISLAAAESPRAVIVDLGEVAEIDSAGLGALMAALRCIRRYGGSMTVCGLQPAVREIVDLTRVHRILSIRGTLDEALAQEAVPARCH